MTSHCFFGDLGNAQVSVQKQPPENWPTFEKMLQRLHQAGILIHPAQLAEFLLAHGLPVHLRYVPVHLQQKATQVNKNYRGDMACLVEEIEQPTEDFPYYM